MKPLLKLLLILICVPVCAVLFLLLIPLLLVLMLFFSLLSRRRWNGGLRWYSTTTFPRGGRGASPSPARKEEADCDIKCTVLDSRIVDSDTPEKTAGSQETEKPHGES